MRLLVVAPNILVPGGHGGSTHVTELVRALRREHDVLLLARRGSRGDGVVPLGFGTARGLAGHALAALHLPAAYHAARAFRPAAIYERFSARGLGVVLGKLLRVPVVAMVLDTDASPLTLRGADRLITTAPRLVPAAFQHKLVQVHWGANVELFRPDLDGGPLRARLGYSRDDFVFGYTGAFYPWHGLDGLVEVVAAAKDEPRCRSFRFLLVGDGQTRAEIEALAGRAGVRDRFTFAGRVPYAEVPLHIAACDACLAPYDPSRHPALKKHGMFFDPLKIFEYLACGKPTIALDTPNVRDLFAAEQAAVLVRPGDRRALLEALLQVAADPAAAAAMGRRGRQLVLQKYSWQAHGEHLGRIFAELVEHR